MPRNDADDAGHVCPGIRIHAIDIVQPPGHRHLPDRRHGRAPQNVTAALAANSSAESQEGSLGSLLGTRR